MDFGESDRKRMMQLAELSEAGNFTPPEQVQFDGYPHVGNLLAVTLSRVRLALKTKPQSRRSS
jgi:hypothetical protein